MSPRAKVPTKSPHHISPLRRLACGDLFDSRLTVCAANLPTTFNYVPSRQSPLTTKSPQKYLPTRFDHRLLCWNYCDFASFQLFFFRQNIIKAEFFLHRFLQLCHTRKLKTSLSNMNWLRANCFKLIFVSLRYLFVQDCQLYE